MILIISSILVSATILLFFWLKSLNKKNEIGWFEPNKELESYYELTNVSLSQKQKSLLNAAVTTTQRLNELEEEKYPVYNLTQDHIISYDLYKFFQQSVKELEVEKMIIGSEADLLKDDWSSSIFREAEVILGKIKKPVSKKVPIDESLFNKKRETLEKRVMARLGISLENK
ncbi:endoplasmic reticulum translocation complex subunit sec 66 [Tubulinosema ratisbonensis]|uniref:Endoplasmic reticulum translocation complex subunit sec 66 n=1 Tax=Tubulinosema ratisbonensis TaxID=291195 RepID=A0A437AP92_9MICR|nr:endoplasmic reticulum translocation complex subunit sec 66 [Tubulinosema ratisbonensis]